MSTLRAYRGCSDIDVDFHNMLYSVPDWSFMVGHLQIRTWLHMLQMKMLWINVTMQLLSTYQCQSAFYISYWLFSLFMLVFYNIFGAILKSIRMETMHQILCDTF